jgi:hypothetical protein
VEERYIDAAKLRDELVQLRSKNRKQTQTWELSACSFSSNNSFHASIVAKTPY